MISGIKGHTLMPLFLQAMQKTHLLKTKKRWRLCPYRMN